MFVPIRINDTGLIPAATNDSVFYLHPGHNTKTTNRGRASAMTQLLNVFLMKNITNLAKFKL